MSILLFYVTLHPSRRSTWSALILASLFCVSLHAEETTSSQPAITLSGSSARLKPLEPGTVFSEGRISEGASGSPNEAGGEEESKIGENAGAQESKLALPLYGVYDDGFSLKSIDDQYQLRVRSLTQIDGKVFSPADQEPARNGIYIPRFRIYLEGQLTDSFEYELSLQRSVEGAFDVLDANVNFVHSKQFQIRIGRALVPYSYAWYDHLEQYYITPERGLFALNFGLARQAGIFAHGQLFQDTLQYAVGGTFGQLSGLADTNTTRDAVGYLNARPFLHSEVAPRLRNFNVGGSLAIGRQAFESQPLPLRTSIQTSENDEAAQAASSIFLEFKDGAVARGERLQGALHTALYMGPLSFEGEWYAARFGSASASSQPAVGLPIFGYDVTIAAFLTGEIVEDRTSIVPLHPVPDGGLGALEIFGRYSRLQLGSEVFTGGLAAPEDWTNAAAITDVGCNWYLSRFVRMTFDWQHSMYGSPVLLNEAKDFHSRRNDLFWARCQLHF